ncbi:MAG: UvrD-helicase domain-containing protein [Bacteroidales bacterium]|nr:UvrD-helicase domain-containing protein [Bacteroidales bacterium]
MLYIYRASAGSGKTFLLTGFYIELLFRKELTPSLEGRDMLFNEILAVTFTNKATAEMKERIIKELNRLWHEPKKSDYYDRITQPDSQGRRLSDSDISHRAHSILKDMLSDYSNLHISTIDSFFQQVVRSFAHELNIQGNYEIALDNDTVLDHAVTQFLLKLDRHKDPETYHWVELFSDYRLQNGSKWNIHQELFSLSQALITEEYRKHSEDIRTYTSDRANLTNYVKMLDKMIRTWRTELKRIGEECCNWMEQRAMQPTDFSGGSRSAANNFVKWAKGEAVLNKTLSEWAENSDKWFTAKSPWQKQLTETDKQSLLQLLQEAVSHMEGEAGQHYYSAMAIRQNIFQLGLLSQLEKEADDYCSEQGIKLISNTTQMLNALIDGESSPFIYEKTGTRIQSFMIDEFQDTSGMQWQNFSPLLRDSLGYDNRNLIVGDVKQSIYRWRGSDWELLYSRLNQFEPDKQAYDSNGNQLRDNWRSDRKIVAFNNAFFAYASKAFINAEPDNSALSKIVDIYADVEQSTDAHNNAYQGKNGKPLPEGEVIFETLEGTGSKYTASVSQRLPELVIALQQRGYQPRDILILCRKRKQCHVCAQALIDYRQQHPGMPYGMDIITQEALLLGHQPVILALVSALYLLLEPRSAYRQCMAGVTWRMLSDVTPAQAFADYFAHPEAIRFDHLLNIPLYETVERLIAMLPDGPNRQTGFLNAFRDVVLNYCNTEGPNLQGFLHWWQDNGHKCSVSTPNDQNAIRIMTIHQSKGLDGEAVIVPFAQDTLDIETQKSKIVWCIPRVAPFAQPNLVVPIQLNANTPKSIFADEYNEERIRAIIDNINTAYVAFTRARHTMIILSPTPSQNGKTITLQRCLSDFVNNEWKQNDKITMNADETETADAVPAPSGTTIEPNTTTPDYVTKTTFHLPLIKQTDYIPPSDSAAARGTTLHAAFSAVQHAADIETPIRRLFDSGRAVLQGCTLDEVISYVRDAINRPKVQAWFATDNRVLTEQDIITQSTHTQRPDRIVLTPDGRTIIIDYKTGAEQPKRHNRQVLHYMSLMEQMGFSNIEGYLWYVDSDKIVTVTN